MTHTHQINDIKKLILSVATNVYDHQHGISSYLVKLAIEHNVKLNLAMYDISTPVYIKDNKIIVITDTDDVNILIAVDLPFTIK